MQSGHQPVGEGGIVSDDRWCGRCGYSIVGLPIAGQCPECGLEIATSLRGLLLRDADPAYLAAVHRGLRLIMFGVIALLVVLLGSGVLTFVLRGKGLAEAIHSTIVITGWLCTSGLLLWGGLCLTTRGDAAISPQGHVLKAAAVRMTASALFGLSLFGAALSASVLLNAISPSYSPLYAVKALAWSNWMMVAMFLLLAVYMTSTLVFCRGLASRVPSRKLWKTANLYTWLLPVIAVFGCLAMFIGPLISMSLYLGYIVSIMGAVGRVRMRRAQHARMESA